MDDLTGTYVGRYQVVNCIHKGTNATIYRGQHLDLPRYAAIKVAHTSDLTSIVTKNFQREADILSALKHQSIVAFYEFMQVISQGNSYPCIIMEYMPGGSLRQAYPLGTKLPIEEILYLLRPIVTALQFVHDAKIVHRDIKPENILVGDNNRLLLSDFGLWTKAYNAENINNTQHVGGTFSYMAPEQFNEKAVAATDQYAVAVMVYEWLCGVRPFQGTEKELIHHHTNTFPPTFSTRGLYMPGIEFVVRKALQKNPANRYSTIIDFYNALLNPPEKFYDAATSLALSSEADALLQSIQKTKSIVLRESRAPITCIAISPDGQKIASASVDRTITLWDKATWEKVLTYRKHSEVVQSLAWSSDGSMIASGAETIHLWRAKDGQYISSYKEHIGKITKIMWFGSGETMSVVSHAVQENTTFFEKKEVYYTHSEVTHGWNVYRRFADWQMPYTAYMNCNGALGCSITNKWITRGATRQVVATVTIWKLGTSIKDTYTYTIPTSRKTRTTDGIRDLVWSPVPNVLAFSKETKDGAEIYIMLCESVIDKYIEGGGFVNSILKIIGLSKETEVVAETGLRLQTLYHKAFPRKGIGCLTWSHDGRYLVYVLERVYVLDVNSGYTTVQELSYSGIATTLYWFPDDNKLAIGTSDGEIVIYSPQLL